jgi:hypothetical protein
VCRAHTLNAEHVNDQLYFVANVLARCRNSLSSSTSEWDARSRL